MNQYIICYDIRDSKRLLKVHNLLKKYAIHIAYSVFIFYGQTKEKDSLMREMFFLTDKTDDLRCYVIPKDLFKIRFGKKVLPEGIILSGLPHQYL